MSEPTDWWSDMWIIWTANVWWPTVIFGSVIYHQQTCKTYPRDLIAQLLFQSCVVRILRHFRCNLGFYIMNKCGNFRLLTNNRFTVCHYWIGIIICNYKGIRKFKGPKKIMKQRNTFKMLWNKRGCIWYCPNTTSLSCAFGWINCLLKSGPVSFESPCALMVETGAMPTS